MPHVYPKLPLNGKQFRNLPRASFFLRDLAVCIYIFLKISFKIVKCYLPVLVFRVINGFIQQTQGLVIYKSSKATKMVRGSGRTIIALHLNRGEIRLQWWNRINISL